MPDTYSNAPYLSQLKSQLGTRFHKVVSKEIDQYKKWRTQARERISETENPPQKLQKKLSALPKSLRSVGANIVGPLSLRRGDNTQLPLLLRCPEGRKWCVGFFVVHTDVGGTWTLTGYQSLRGKIQPAKGETQSYRPDDLSQAAGSVDSFLETVESVSQMFTQYAAQDGGPGLSAGGGGLFPQGGGVDLEGGSGSPQNAVEASSSSTMKQIQSNSMSLGTDTSSGETVPGVSGTLSANKVFRRLRNRHTSTAPKWFTKLYFSRTKKKKLKKFIRKYGADIYNRAAGSHTEKQMWDALEEAGKKTGLLGGDYCHTQGRSISPRNGVCNYKNRCRAFEDDGSGACVHQSASVS
jgi:hypothetical protein